MLLYCHVSPRLSWKIHLPWGKKAQRLVWSNHFMEAIKCSGFWHSHLYPLRRTISDSFVENPFSWTLLSYIQPWHTCIHTLPTMVCRCNFLCRWLIVSWVEVRSLISTTLLERSGQLFSIYNMLRKSWILHLLIICHMILTSLPNNVYKAIYNIKPHMMLIKVDILL